MLTFGSTMFLQSPAVLVCVAVRCRSAHEVLRGQDTSLLAPEETPEEVLREQEARAAAVSAVQDKLRAGSAGEIPLASNFVPPSPRRECMHVCGTARVGEIPPALPSPERGHVLCFHGRALHS
jgi:hypothetical protein